MNLSGDAVLQVLNDFPVLQSKNIVVITDDLNLPFGTLRFRKNGSDGGQNGLKSIINRIGSKEFPRLRIGIGNEFEDPIKHVLGKFNSEEQNNLTNLIELSADAIEHYIQFGIQEAMNQYNGLNINL